MNVQCAASSVSVQACACLTSFGDEKASLAALLRGEKALKLTPVRGVEGGDFVPLALLPGRALDETLEPQWFSPVAQMLQPVQDRRWGTPEYPIFITSSNFGASGLYAFRRSANTAFLAYGSTKACVNWLRLRLGWGENITVLSHACVSAHVGLLQASRALNAGFAKQALVFSFDFLSPFVAGGFHALKILNNDFPAPYQARETGSIALGDGAAYAVLTKEPADFRIEIQALYNEMFHFTANQPDGLGFRSLLTPVAQCCAGRRLWIKGHGTGTLDAGRLEAGTLASIFPGSPLVGWKGSLGHTLGSCGLVELSIAMESIRSGFSPGTVGTSGPTFSPEVATAPFDNRGFDGLLCLSNAFGGAHAAFLLCHA
ncbi:MAG: hypothetical protein WC378_03255 [Opitutaceae bacterium]|jgi:hypothetical protein